MKKRFVGCIYLWQEHAVKNLNDLTVLETPPLRLAKYYDEQGVDELILFDLSKGDTEHEAALDLIKEICASVECDCIGAGNIKRMEDVKKLIYAGCKKVILNYELQSNVELTKEVSQKFGKDKMLACFGKVESIFDNLNTANEYLSGLVLLNPHIIREVGEITKLPAYVFINQIQLNKLIEIAQLENVSGITGNTINDNVKEIGSLKDLCKQNGIEVEMLEPAIPWADLKKNADGLIPVVVQDYQTLEVLMVAYMNEQAYIDTHKTGKMHYYSRSRQSQWLKGETSGHFQYVKSLTTDCDMDTILAKVHQIGVACHTGARSCFFNEISKKEYEAVENPLQVFEDVFSVIKDRKIHPKEGSYTNYLFDKGIDKILKKLGEEATEIVIAAKNPNPNEIKYEISDFLYHCMVLMAEKNVTWEEITRELANR
ncbi:MAG: bifunctional phosphoribosyl-AMP cyclohydrolase/phosphoribosyl-ATP diphosphatase HisIE [Lachnospiraceae bacterium]|nr:bifunctional phosphoribosyl-AMP cyclohydrolase/phosphoribosyl-ATP diphosphatase HisIE [Lachnospiraceae bacterium]